MVAVLNPFPFGDLASKSEFWIWLTPLVFLMASCLSHVYTISFFCSTSIHLQSSLNVTLAKTFQDNSGESVKWAKLSFFIGFALGQFTVGILGDYYGKWKVWNYLIKILIILGMLPSFTSKLLVFWSTTVESQFLVAFFVFQETYWNFLCYGFSFLTVQPPATYLSYVQFYNQLILYMKITGSGFCAASFFKWAGHWHNFTAN